MLDAKERFHLTHIPDDDTKVELIAADGSSYSDIVADDDVIEIVLGWMDGLPEQKQRTIMGILKLVLSQRG